VRGRAPAAAARLGRPERQPLSVDGKALRTCANPPRYPLRVMLAVYDFPDRAAGREDHVPRLVVDRVSGR
jgi:hypothetical protein